MQASVTKTNDWVAKFGGTSVADYQAMTRCMNILAAYPNVRVIVVSAPSGVTNLLVKLAAIHLTHPERLAIQDDIHHKISAILKTFPTSIQAAVKADIERILSSLAESVTRLTHHYQLKFVDELLACGEQISTVLFTALLIHDHQPAKKIDARQLIKTNDHFGKADILLSETEEAVSHLLLPECKQHLMVTEGFIGSTLSGETTTLGRGGSDYSAAILAEAMRASVLQIWTDVSGIYTVDPELAPKATPIENMSFAEAAELATFGAKVLHPSTLWPAIRKNIPVFVGSSLDVNAKGTWIHAKQDETPELRAIALRRHQSLLTITSLEMLQAHGFLATIFNILARHQLSVDLVTTSEISVALTLNDADIVSKDVFAELQQIGNVSLNIEKNLSLIALVGNALQATSGLSGELFNEINHFNIRLICHGASSHNLCFLVNETDAKEIIQLLHAKFFENKYVNDYFDVQAILQQRNKMVSSGNQWPIPITTELKQNHLIVGGCDVVELVEQFNTPLYLLDEKHIRTTCRELIAAAKKRPIRTKILYASKAFSTIATDTIIREEGLGIDVMSEGELLTALKANFSGDMIYFHGNNKSKNELKLGILNQCRIVVDNWHELDLLIELAHELSLSRIDLLIRFTPNVNSFTHQHIRTGQIDSKFGFNYDEVHEVIARVKQHSHLNCLGLHAHIGSQISDLQAYQALAKIAAELLNEIYHTHHLSLSEINLGGGLGVNYTGFDDFTPSIDEWLSALINTFLQYFSQKAMPLPTLLIEPGRAIIATAGMTAYRIGSQKTIKTGKKYIAVDGGMSDNPRPITYGAENRVIIGNQVEAAHQEKVTVVGKHCESGDVLFKDVILPITQPGDILIAAGTGAYNYSQSSNYNRLPRAAVILVSDSKAKIIVERETSLSLLAHDQTDFSG